MKLKINSKELQNALNTVMPAIPSRSVIPINECVLIQPTETEVFFTGTNSNLTIETKITEGVKFDSGFDMCVNFQELRGIASRLTGDVVIEDINGQIVITGDGGKWKAGKSIDAVNFSKGRPFEPSWSIPLEADANYWMMQALRCTEPKSELTYLKEVWVNIYDGKIDIAAADGKAMFRYQSEVDKNISFKGVVNPSFVKAVGNLQGWATIESDGKSIRIKTDKTQITVVLSEATLPTYEKFYNMERTFNVEVNREEMLAAVRGLFVYNTVDTMPHIVQVKFPKDALEIHFEQPETDKTYFKQVAAKHNLSIDKMYFIATSLETLLSMFPSTTETIKMCIEAPNKIIFIKSDEDPLTLGLNPLAYNN
jgi:DNA polymerase III sliding clamp (beta) subunit (PCNA family)